MRVKRIKCFSEEEVADRFNNVYDKFIEKDKPEARKRMKKEILKGAGIGAGIGTGLGLAIKKLDKNKHLSAPVSTAIIGSSLGSAGFSYGRQNKIQKKTYDDNKTELAGILAGFKSEKEKHKFLDTLENELKDN